MGSRMKLSPSAYDDREWQICVQISGGKPSNVGSGFPGSGGCDIVRAEDSWMCAKLRSGNQERHLATYNEEVSWKGLSVSLESLSHGWASDYDTQKTIISPDTMASMAISRRDHNQMSGNQSLLQYVTKQLRNGEVKQMFTSPKLHNVDWIH